MVTVPPDNAIIAAFNKGRTRGGLKARWGNEPPYKNSQVYLRDAWIAGFEESRREA